MKGERPFALEAFSFGVDLGGETAVRFPARSWKVVRFVVFLARWRRAKAGWLGCALRTCFGERERPFAPPVSDKASAVLGKAFWQQQKFWVLRGRLVGEVSKTWKADGRFGGQMFWKGNGRQVLRVLGIGEKLGWERPSFEANVVDEERPCIVKNLGQQPAPFLAKSVGFSAGFNNLYSRKAAEVVRADRPTTLPGDAGAKPRTAGVLAAV